MRTVFGIDISSKTSNVAISVDQNVVNQYKFDNDQIGFDRLLNDLNSVKEPEIVFEATGVYSRSLQKLLQDHGYQYTCLNPLVAKKQLDSLRPRKTDATDAFNLAQTQFQLNRKPSYQQDPVYDQLKDLSRFYQEISTDLVRAKTRLHRALQMTFPSVERILSTPNGTLYWNLVKRYPLSTMVPTGDPEELAPVVLNSTNKNMSQARALKIAAKLQDLAQACHPAVSSNSSMIKQVRYLADEALRLQDLKHDLIQEMIELAQDLPEYEILLSIPGIGEVTAVLLIAEIGDIRRFTSANKVNAYIGIDLRHYESGNYEAADHISKRGNPYGRKILYQMVMNIVSSTSSKTSKQMHVADYYRNKKQSAPSHSTKKIAIASMHRLLRTMYILIIKNQKYSYHPTTKRQ
ncbi:IS110 family transposase [Xylocopilactobacillus apicola]|uniref:IS110 family transposase n=1 Tax=Xylocopilactobacillus apicola TaxID=2932184 RepID=A0AAU9DSG7_9LACO|nr:IS110 family transposase [Xylocopilactobacillus apicola]BDR58103.1 IS110 family transposase [Xylocopilactobacillus apicola]BDR58984.1 IS110 family transposase [Xylocopilactobacillus apicola]BDR58993.1 IS110 family transposase [Xylocopilactobacillus apicola]